MSLNHVNTVDATNKKKALDLALSTIEKQFGKGAIMKLGDSIRDEQEVLMHLSNMVMYVFAIDTALHRLKKKSSSAPLNDVVEVFASDAMERMEFSARQVLAAISEGETLRTQSAAVRGVLERPPVNTIKARQRIADYLTDHGRYAL